ncbi:cellulose synthase/poly-beta-1,6-N-acetylglucosamine synthase-like glycosyltransferase [Bradyrhizobium sp. USDA 3650]
MRSARRRRVWCRHVLLRAVCHVPSFYALLLLDQYETQFFQGKPSDSGEDRHPTILCSKQDFEPSTFWWPLAPSVVSETLLPYLRQQLRWARSTYRDTLLGLHLLPGLDRYPKLNVVGQNLGPLLLAISSLAALAQLGILCSWNLRHATR